jgi:hypothetical protein
MRDKIYAGAVLACLLLAASPLQAGGLEYTGQGAQALGRGGAVAARADDPMVLAHNPAGLAELRGSQFLINLNVALFDACFTGSGYYGWGTYLGGNKSQLPDPDGGPPAIIPLSEIDNSVTPAVAAAHGYYIDPFDTVCLDQRITPIPQIVWTRRLSEDLGIGIGLIFPAATPSGRWGGKYGVIRGDTGELRPAPSRYMLLDTNNLGIFPNVGLGYRIFEALRLGLSLEWGIVGVNTTTMAGTLGGNSPSNDVMAHVKAQDWFIPGFTASVHLVPIDSIDLVVAFRYQDDIDATGDVDLTTGLFDPALRPHTTNHLTINSVKQAMPWKLRAGIRYADRFAPRPAGTGRWEADASTPHRIHDPLQDERWDLEFDVEYQMTDRNDAQRLVYELRQRVEFMTAEGMITSAEAPTETTIEKRWQNQLVARLGSTYTLMPGKFGVSAGAHYETRGLDPDYMQIDFWPLQRIGLHGGVIVRVAKSIDFVFSYAHIFQETLRIAPPPHLDRAEISTAIAAGGNPKNMDKTVGALLDRTGYGQMVLEERKLESPDGVARVPQVVTRQAASQPPTIINAGTYSSNFDVFSVGVNVHF